MIGSLGLLELSVVHTWDLELPSPALARGGLPQRTRRDPALKSLELNVVDAFLATAEMLVVQGHLLKT